MQAAIAGKPLVVHDDGQQTRCFAHVDDVIQFVLRLMDTPAAMGEVVNIGSDKPVSILQLAERVNELAGGRSEIQFQSYSAAYNEDFEDIRRRVPDLTKLHALTGRQAEQGLDDIIRELIQEHAN